MDYQEYRLQVKALRESGKTNGTIRLLRSLIDFVEFSEWRPKLGGVSWYYEELARVYRRMGDRVAERKILRRFARLSIAPPEAKRRAQRRLRFLERVSATGDT